MNSSEDVKHDVKQASQEVKQEVGQASREVAPWVERFSRFGYAAKGAVYVLIGILAALAAFNLGGETTGSQGALQSLLGQPFGKVLLGIIAIGLLGYALWRLLEATLDVDDKGLGIKGVAKRIGYLFSAFAYGGLAVSACQLILGWGGSGSSSLEFWTAWLLAKPLGRWLVALLALPFIGLALNAVYVAFSALFRKKLKLSEMSPAGVTLVTQIGRLGLIARGVVLGVIGVFLIRAALFANAGEAADVEQAMDILAGIWPGPWVLGSVAIGLIAYGVYAMLEAKYRRINI